MEEVRHYIAVEASPFESLRLEATPDQLNKIEQEHSWIKNLRRVSWWEYFKYDLRHQFSRRIAKLRR